MPRAVLPQSCPRLNEIVTEMVKDGCRDASNSLGIRKMPDGYALMIDPDDFYFWLHESGIESVISWNKWAIYRGAKIHAERS